jgi:hypothetical protein
VDEGAACLNCGAPLAGAYCHDCGQKAGPAVEPVREMVAEALDELLSFNEKLPHTIGPLVARPGFLTCEYLAGRHQRYVRPLKLYLIASVVHLSLLALLGSTSFFFFRPSNDNPGSIELIAMLPRAMFLLVPGFALLLRLVYGGRRGVPFAADLVFALHFHAVAFLVSTVHAVLELPRWSAGAGGSVGRAAVGAADAVLAVWLFAYLYLAMRRVYGSGPLGTALRMVALLASYVVLLMGTVFAAVLVMATLHL